MKLKVNSHTRAGYRVKINGKINWPKIMEKFSEHSQLIDKDFDKWARREENKRRYQAEEFGL